MAELQLIKCLNPLDRREREISRHPYFGESLLSVRNQTIPPDIEVIISINGKVIPDEHLYLTTLRDGDYIAFVPKLAGGDFWRGLAFVAVLVVANMAGQYWVNAMAPGYGAAVAYGGAALITAGVAIAGAAVVNAVMPVSMDVATMDSMDSATSQVYSWNPQTVQQQGIVIPKIYGRNKLYGNIIEAFIENQNDDQFINALICLGLGPIYNLTTFYINDQPYQNFTDIDPPVVKYGELDQIVIPYFSTTKLEFSTGLKVVYGSAVTYTTVDADFDGLEIDITFTKGLWYANDQGGLDSNSVSVSVEISTDGVNWYHLATQSTASGYVSETGRWSNGAMVWSGDDMDRSGAWVEYAAGNADPYAHKEGEYTEYVAAIGYCYWHWLEGEIATSTAEYNARTVAFNVRMRPGHAATRSSTGPDAGSGDVDRGAGEGADVGADTGADARGAAVGRVAAGRAAVSRRSGVRDGAAPVIAAILGRGIGPVASRGRPAPDSNFSTLASNDAASLPIALDASRTRVTSSTSRGSGARRMSSSASPRISMARTTDAMP